MADQERSTRWVPRNSFPAISLSSISSLRKAIDEAIERQTVPQKPSQTFRLEPEDTVKAKNLEIIKRMEHNEKWLPWKKGVDKAAEAAENQEIVADLRKKHPDYDSDSLIKYRTAGLLKGAPDPRDYGGSDPINAIAALYSPYRRYHSYLKHYAALPHNDRGAYLQLSRGVQRIDIQPDPKEVPSGEVQTQDSGRGERLRSFPSFHRNGSS